MPRLFGDRIMLREYQKEDLPYIRQWCNDGEITEHLSDRFLYPQTVNASEAFLNGVLEGKSDFKGFVIASKDSAEYIGQIDLFQLDWKNRSAELGIVIGRKDLLGAGYGSEAIRLLLDFAFDSMNLNRVYLELHEANRRGRKCYEKCGFKEEGRLKEKLYKNGRYIDMIIMSVLKREHEANRQP
ncbi:GNAT family N-acetyltransferase [Gorillibacterium massiliense]|uniref:GNAT family N-acetyltransferase n=1 Tax=Gorillibacterium massiliense TaxID=1280390 RepID=UPI0004AEB122|nr:GNAT family protein [Gorillibacterium massiliense]